MASKTNFVRSLLLTLTIVGVGSAAAQDELRKTFFKDVDAAREAAEAVEARLYGPRSYADGAEDYSAAEVAPERGRIIEYVCRISTDAE